jgi:two-component system, chemotaxis family, protein-glutamate methylesterase/glutaminase
MAHSAASRSVLIVDDSSMMRRLIASIIERTPGLSVAGNAASAEEGWDQHCALHPDSVVLDMELPGRHGFALLERIMRQAPCPVVMVSARGDSFADSTVRALELGALDFVDKPNAGDQTLESFSAKLTSLLLGARPRASAILAEMARSSLHSPSHRSALAVTPTLLAIGASTGGVAALTQLMRGMKGYRLPIVVTQHMPPGYTARLAIGLSEASGLKSREARHGDKLEAGTILIAPGGAHLAIQRDSNGYHCSVTEGELVTGHRPSVDVLFQSVAETAGAAAIGTLLTGMGRDGAKGLLAMRQAGARTLCQDEATCVVFGMPKAAIDLGAAEAILPLGDIARRLFDLSSKDAPRQLLRA